MSDGQPSLLHEAEAPDAATAATAAAVTALLESGCPSCSIIVPGLAAPAGSKVAVPVPTGSAVTSLHGLKPFTQIVVDRKGVARFGRSIVKDSAEKTLKPWQQLVRANAQTQRVGAILEGALAIVVQFSQIRPKSHYRTGRSTSHLLASHAPRQRTTMPDATKLLRGFEDALTAVVWDDDAQIVWQLAEKVYGARDEATITVFELGPA